MKENRLNKKIISVLVLISVLFLMLIGYITYFEFALSEGLQRSPYNRRVTAAEDKVLRGSISDRNGVILANSSIIEVTKKNKSTEKNQIRNYPFGNLYCHIIGYNSKIYGKSQLEMQYNKQLIGMNDLSSLLNLSGEQKGYDITTTIDHNLQTIVERNLKGYNGAVVVLNSKTGEVLAMCSKPDFNPLDENLKKNWNNIVEDKNSPLLNRAISGLYPAGSVGKIITSAAILENGLENETYSDTGKFTIGNNAIQNYGGGVYGDMSLERAFTISCNTYFCNMGVKLGENILKETANKFFFNKSLDYDLPAQKPFFPTNKLYSPDLALLSIGQSKLLVSPLYMALVVSSVDNSGKMCRPYLIKSIKNSNGNTIFQEHTSNLTSVIDSHIADKIKNMMYKVVEEGTGRGMQISGVKIGGKTGTAENERKNKDHSWFVCFLPEKNIAMSVILEYTGQSGGALAVPLARRIISEYLKK